MLKKLLELIGIAGTEGRKLSFSLIIINFLGSLFGLVGIASIIPFISILSNPDMIFDDKRIFMIYDFLNYTDKNIFIIHMGIVLLAVFIISNLFLSYRTWFNINYSQKISFFVTDKLFRKYIHNSYQFFLGNNTSELVKNIFSEVNNVITHIIKPLVEVVSNVFLSLAIMIFLLIIKPGPTIFMLLTLSVMYGILFYFIKNMLSKAGKARLSANKDRFKAAQEAFGGIKDLKLIGREEIYMDKFYRSEMILKKSETTVNVLSQIPKYFLETIAFGTIIVIAMFLFISSNNSIAEVLPILALYAFAGYRLMPAMQIIYRSITVIRGNWASVNVLINDFNDREFVEPDVIKENSGHSVQFNEKIELKDVVFSYKGTDKAVIDNLNLSIKKNSMTAFVGTTGCGKTTIIDIILTLLIPESGTLLVDGTPITSEFRRSWQSKLGYVPQQIFLTDDTVVRNIAFAESDDEIDFERVKHAAEIANIHEAIMNDFPSGYQTIVGERGARLSGGQRQRIGIARALYRNPEVLVFDEATSALDNLTEAAVMEAINNLMGEKTIIIIAHRLSTVKKCDCIFYMDRGVVTASGTYDELINDNEAFRNASLG